MAVLFVASAIWGRVVGVPQGVKNLLVEEFVLRGLEIDAGKLTIDPLGGLVARDVVVYRDGGRKVEQLRIGRVELNLNWWGWRDRGSGRTIWWRRPDQFASSPTSLPHPPF